MDKKKSSVVDRAVIKGAAEMVARCKGKRGKRYAGSVRRQNILHQAALAVENEIRKDPEAFARYIVSRMAWDLVRDVQTDVYMA